MSVIKSFSTHPTTSGMMTCYVAILDCGHWFYNPGWRPFPDSVKAGDSIDCVTCSNHAEAEKHLESLDKAQVSYLRFNTRFAYPEQGIFGQYHAYTRDSSSPSGVKHLASFPATKAIDAIIDRRGLCTLSPTEYR